MTADPQSRLTSSVPRWALWLLVAAGAGVSAISVWLLWWLNQETARSFWVAETPLSNEAFHSSLEITADSQELAPQVATVLLIILGLGIIATAAFPMLRDSRKDIDGDQSPRTEAS